MVDTPQALSIVLRTEVDLTEDDLSKEAKEQFINHTEILHIFQFNARHVLANDRLSPIGRHLVCMMLEQNYSNYKNVLNYIAVRPELKNAAKPIPNPIVICGLPRTGTTLLLNLLACDPACRAPLFLDMMDPIPPLSRSDADGQNKRNIKAKAFDEMLNALGLIDYQKEVQASHPSFPYDEDLFMFGHVGVLWLNSMLVSNTDNDLLKWFVNDSSKDFIYEYHRMFFQMLNSVEEPSSHWVLKASIHLLHLDTLVRYYPTVSLIMTHRRLEEMLPSCARLGLAYTSAYFDSSKSDVAIDRKMVVELLLVTMDTFIRRLVEFRRTNKCTPVLDIQYEDLIAHPLDTVRQIYQHFKLSWSNEIEQAMLAWLRENPTGKHGRHLYALDEFGLERETLDKRYEEYNRMFFKTPEPSQTEDNPTKVQSSS